MQRLRIEFIGQLAHVDSSILSVQLDHGFEFAAISPKELRDIISNTRIVVPLEFQNRYEFYKACTFCAWGMVFVVRKSFEIEPMDAETRSEPASSPAVKDFLNNEYRDYLDSVLKRLRLFKEGAISIPAKYCYYLEDGVPRLIAYDLNLSMKQGGPRYLLDGPEVLELKELMTGFRLPFEDPILSLAHQFFEESYRVDDARLSFLMSMMGLEVLVTSVGKDPSDSLPERASAHLGKSVEEQERMREHIEHLFSEKSRILSGSGQGTSDRVEVENALLARDCLRRLIVTEALQSVTVS